MALSHHKRYNLAQMVSTKSSSGINIGVDIGGSKILVVAGDERYRILRSQKIETPESAGQGLVEITHLIEKVAGHEPIRSIVVAAPGPLDRAKGVILKTPNMEWENVEVVNYLNNHFKVPVSLEKDADAAALAEATIGAAKGQPYVLYVTISTGIGTGVIINGQIYHGASDPEGGHMDITAEGRSEEFEYAASGKALIRRFGKAGYQITDPKVWDEFAKDLAVGLHNLIVVLSPSVVVIGGGVGVHFHKFEAFLRQHLVELQPAHYDPLPIPPIVPAQNMETAVAYGTLILASKLLHLSQK
jgi:glucokinase